MPSHHIQTGQLGEDIACRVLARRGYEIIERNWRCRAGEIDIVARDGPCWAFVEVKTRHEQSAELAEESLTQRKAQRLVGLAQTYLSDAQLGDVDWRIDLVAIELDRRDCVSRFNLVPGIRIEL